MPTQTTVHSINKPLGNENVTRAAYNAVLDKIDAITRGITPMTTAERNALTGAQKWTDRIVRVTDAVAGQEFQRWTGAAWTTDLFAPYVLDTEKGVAGGVATLGGDGILTAGQRPPGTPLADAAPPAIADAGAVGVSAEAAREDHTHAPHAQTALRNASTPFTVEQIIQRALATDPVLSAFVVGEANARAQLRPDGVRFGPGGATALGVMLRRQAANALEVMNDALSDNGDFKAKNMLADRLDFRTDTTRNLRWGAGSPEGAVAASVGAEYLRTDGAAGTVLYVKESGTGNTGWAPVGGQILIAESVLGSNTTTVTFSSIPASFRHLLLVVNGKIEDAGADLVADINARVNNDSGGNYDYQRTSGINATLATARGLAGSQWPVGRFAKRAVTSIGSLELLLPDYSRATFAQTAIGRASYASTDATEHYIMTGQWRTAAVVNRIDLTPGAGDPFLAGTVFSLYGLR